MVQELSNAADETLNKVTDDRLKKAALDYHEKPIPGKLSINITKPTESQ